MDPDSREVLGLAKEDLWYYPCLGMLVGACFLSDPVLVAVLFALSTVFLLVYLAKSTPKYRSDESISKEVRVYGLVSNAVFAALQVVVIAVKFYFLMS